MLCGNVKYTMEIKLHGKGKGGYGSCKLVGVPAEAHRKQEKEYQEAQHANTRMK